MIRFAGNYMPLIDINDFYLKILFTVQAAATTKH